MYTQGNLMQQTKQKVNLLYNTIVQRSGDQRGWVSRPAIAQCLGQKRITGTDAVMLDMLVIMGKLEAKQQPEASGKAVYTWVYRPKLSSCSHS
jgi:hypothetical protein